MPDSVEHSMSPQDALVALMVAVSASDENIRTSELVKIQSIVGTLPVFLGYDTDRIKHLSQMVFDLFDQDDGLDALFGLMREALPERLHETAYALSCDVAAADGTLTDTEAAASRGVALRTRARPPARRRDRARSPRTAHAGVKSSPIQ